MKKEDFLRVSRKFYEVPCSLESSLHFRKCQKTAVVRLRDELDVPIDDFWHCGSLECLYI